MADEVQREFILSPHPTNNPNCVFDKIVPATNDNFCPSGWAFRSGENAELMMFLPAIPQEIHATTPAGKIRVHWTTAVATTNVVKFYVTLEEKAPNTSGALQVTAWDESLSGTDTNVAAYTPHTVDIAISTISLTAGDMVMGVLRRDDGDAADTLSGLILVTAVQLVATKA